MRSYYDRLRAAGLLVEHDPIGDDEDEILDAYSEHIAANRAASSVARPVFTELKVSLDALMVDDLMADDEQIVDPAGQPGGRS